MKTRKSNNKQRQFKKFTGKEQAFLKKIVGGEEDDQATYDKVKW